MRTSGTTHSYLVSGALPDLSGVPSIQIQEAYLAPTRNREVIARKCGADYSLVVQDTLAQPSSPYQLPIPSQTFDDLWRLPGSHRVALTRYFFPIGQDVIEIDVFEGPHAPLVIARIQFSTVSREKRFRKPAFLREEIAADQFFQLRQIALYGNPLAKIGVPQAGALPFLFKKGILHVVLVTSSSGTRWIIPKGKLEPRMTYEQVALMEAAEEAGAIGIIEPGIPALCQLDDKRPLYLYPMRVATLLPLWPDRFVRRRVVLPIYEALLRIVDVDLARAIRSLARQIPLEPTSE